MIDFIIGLLIGAGVVGSSVYRTLAVDKGDVKLAFNSSIVNGISYFLSVYFIANNNYTAYGGTILGSTMIVVHMARKNKKI